MTDDAPPPSFEPGTGRPMPRPRPASPPPPAPAGPVRRAVPRTSPGRSRPATPGAAPAPDQAPPSGAPAGYSAGSRTSREVNATRAMPLAPGAPVPRPPAARPGGPGGSGGSGRAPAPRSRRPRATYRRRRLLVVAFVLVLLLAWPVGLVVWADSRLAHTDALSDLPSTPATTYLLAGSDSRADGTLAGDPTEGARTDTVMLLTDPGDGTASLVSLPRDTLVDVPGHGENKLNAAYSLGGAPLLVATVEGLTDITVDHYVEIGMGGVASIVDAVGGVNLCWDDAVDDADSGMVWTPGCHDVDGTQALAFARMRKSDPTGDIGRGLRQQQVIQGVTSKLSGPSLLLPWEQVPLVTAGTDALVTDPATGVVDLGRMALTFRSASGPGGFRGSPPIADPDYREANLGSSVLLDAEASALFWQQAMDGTLPTQQEQDAANQQVPEGQG